MIYQDKELLYDFTAEEYYLTLDGILARTDYTDHEIGLIFSKNTPKWISQAVYRLIWNEFEGVEKDLHIKFMKRMIYDNLNGEREWLLRACIELVRGAVESGMDLSPYTKDGAGVMPVTVRECLRNGRLLNGARKVDGTVLDIVYTVADHEVN